MSLAKRIIPCLDVTNGRVVKGVNFVELRDAGDPVGISRRYDEQGADELTKERLRRYALAIWVGARAYASQLTLPIRTSP